MTVGYEDCDLKIERAVKHIGELMADMRNLSADDSYIIMVNRDPDGGDDSIKLSAVQIVPQALLCVIGDAIHNLRTALDFAINHMVVHPTKFTKFPVQDSRKQLEDAINGGLAKYAPHGVVDFIMDFIQPYKGGRGEFIWAAHELDIHDKHGTLIAHNELKFVHGITGVDESGAEVTIPTWLIVDGKVATEKLRGHHNVKITDKGRTTLRIVFGEGMPLQGLEVLPTLFQIANFVSGTIDNIATQFPVWPQN